jgi:hypothetical protein
VLAKLTTRKSDGFVLSCKRTLDNGDARCYAWREHVPMSKENQQWGASRIHGELLMLGFEVAQSTVSKYLVRGGTPPSQSWKTFLRNHAQAIAAIDLFPKDAPKLVEGSA